MHVLINTKSPYIKNKFLTALLPAGIKLCQTEHSENVINEIQNLNPELIILDAINEDFDAIFILIKEIKDHIIKTGVLLLIGTIDKQSVMTAIQLGVIGFIKSDATDESINKYVSESYKKIHGSLPERKYERIKIDTTNPNDRIGIKFRSPVNSQLIIGQILNISLGGIAVELFGTLPPDSIPVGSEVNNLKFIVDGKDIDADGIVVVYKNNFCAFKFKDMSSEIRDAIAQYIFIRIKCAD